MRACASAQQQHAIGCFVFWLFGLAKNSLGSDRPVEDRVASFVLIRLIVGHKHRRELADRTIHIRREAVRQSSVFEPESLTQLPPCMSTGW